MSTARPSEGAAVSYGAGSGPSSPDKRSSSPADGTGDVPTLVVARGRPDAQGAIVGEATAQHIEAALALYEQRFRDEAGLDEDGRRRRGTMYVGIVREYSPRTAQLLDAMSESAGVERSDLYLLNARSEVLYGSSRPPHEADGACTTGAVLGSRSADGSTYVLENWDWRRNLHEQMYMLATEDEDGHRIVTLAEAGMVAKAGMNSAGLGVALNLLASDRNRRVPSVPIHIILREVLQQRRLSRALNAALQAKREGSANLLLASHEGDAIDLELVADDFNHVLPLDGILAHANHFQVCGPWSDTFAAQAAFTLLRDVRLRRTLEGDGAQVSVDTMHRALADHGSFPDGVCRHDDPDVDPNLRTATLCSMIMNLSEQTIRVTARNPCEGRFGTYALADFFDDRARAADTPAAAIGPTPQQMKVPLTGGTR